MLELTQAKTQFLNWWGVMQAMQALHGEPADKPLDSYEGYDELMRSHTTLLITLRQATGIREAILQKAVLMAMREVLQDSDTQPTEAQVDAVMDRTLTISASIEAVQHRLQGKLLN